MASGAFPKPVARIGGRRCVGYPDADRLGSCTGKSSQRQPRPGRGGRGRLSHCPSVTGFQADNASLEIAFYQRWTNKERELSISLPRMRGRGSGKGFVSPQKRVCVSTRSCMTWTASSGSQSSIRLTWRPRESSRAGAKALGCWGDAMTSNEFESLCAGWFWSPERVRSTAQELLAEWNGSQSRRK